MGRPYFYALGAGGERGVAHMLDFMREGLERTMALSGVRSLAEIDRELVRWK
ncbi:alpha-hydroxy-acid oxidizing protein [Ilumatobacter sp.]|uniref:alpha-hydroxy-acid oxidizing protein n=1 Tax=Ilumatobacter sp. TaxID=1967498 RepID=UPI00375315CD|nr:alpha-hydroxy-acid oxidizing protein [Ilumatobacter sp.]